MTQVAWMSLSGEQADVSPLDKVSALATGIAAIITPVKDRQATDTATANRFNVRVLGMTVPPEWLALGTLIFDAHRARDGQS
jgi:hypothetical protein